MNDLLVRAAVSDGNGHTTVRELTLPGQASRLRVESSAVCGTDLMLHAHGLKAPAVLGHHAIGRIDQLTESAAASLGLPTGTRVAVEEYVPCGQCATCRAGDYRFCATVDLWTGGERVGMIPASRGSGLHGGNAQYIELCERHVLHQVPEHLSPEEAAWILPLANAVDWTHYTGGVGPGAKVAIIGPGYHGLSCVAAARALGAETVVALGRSTDAGRLQLAQELGASTATSDVTVADDVRDRFGPLDVVVDTVGTRETITLAQEMLDRRGVLVLAGLAEDAPALDPQGVIRKLLQVKGVRGRSPAAVSRAIQLLAEQITGLERIPTHFVCLEGIETTLRSMAQGQGPVSPHVVVDPWRGHEEHATNSAKESIS